MYVCMPIQAKARTRRSTRHVRCGAESRVKSSSGSGSAGRAMECTEYCKSRVQ
jgi:hypothetical protein